MTAGHVMLFVVDGADFVEGSVVAPLIGVHIVEGRGVLQARRSAPVGAEGDRTPGSLRSKFLLSDIMVQAAAVHSHTAAQDEGHDAGAVDEVIVIPVVGAGSDNDRTFAAALFCRSGPFSGEIYYNC